MIHIKYFLPLLVAAVIVHGKKFLIETDDHDNKNQGLNYMKQGESHIKQGHNYGKQKQNKDKHIKQGQNTLDTPEGDDYILPLLPFIAGVVPTIIEQIG